MEAVAYVAGEPWSDNPACACWTIGNFLREWNDVLPDADRDALLRPLIRPASGPLKRRCRENGTNDDSLAQSERRAFDFWTGLWRVTDPDGGQEWRALSVG